MHVEARTRLLVSFSGIFLDSLIFLKAGSLIGLGWLASEPQEPGVSTSLVLGLQGHVTLTPDFLLGF